MKTTLTLILMLTCGLLMAQDDVTVVSSMADGLDLQAVSELFKDSENLEEFDIVTLRAIQYSGAPLSSGLFYRIRDVFGKVDMINAYGMTELDAVSAIYPEEHDQYLGSVGRALPKTFVRVVRPENGNPDKEVKKGEVGEIIVRSPCVMKE